MDADHIIVPFVALTDTALRPTRAKPGDAAFDLHADIPPWFDEEEEQWVNSPTLTLEPGGTCLVKTGIAIELPDDCAGLVLPRSGLAIKHGITVLNAPGLIDSGYRGEVGVILHNTTPRDRDSFGNFKYAPFVVNPGDRIAQLLIVRVTQPSLVHASMEQLSESERGALGFGSTGV